jgi:hypothetical protein
MDSILTAKLAVVVRGGMKGLVTVGYIMAQVCCQKDSLAPFAPGHGHAQGLGDTGYCPGQDPISIDVKMMIVFGLKRIQVVGKRPFVKLRIVVDVDPVTGTFQRIGGFASIRIAGMSGDDHGPALEACHLRGKMLESLLVHPAMDPTTPSPTHCRKEKDHH